MKTRITLALLVSMIGLGMASAHESTPKIEGAPAIRLMRAALPAFAESRSVFAELPSYESPENRMSSIVDMLDAASGDHSPVRDEDDMTVVCEKVANTKKKTTYSCEVKSVSPSADEDGSQSLFSYTLIFDRSKSTKKFRARKLEYAAVG